MAERVIQTLRKKLARAQTQTGSKNFLNILPDLVKNYNNTVHSATKFRPSKVTEADQPVIWDNLFGHLVGQKPKKLQFNVSDIVRISAAKLTFDKASRSEAWTRELFKVAKAVPSVPVNYFYLVDLNGEPIQGSRLLL